MTAAGTQHRTRRLLGAAAAVAALAAVAPVAAAAPAGAAAPAARTPLALPRPGLPSGAALEGALPATRRLAVDVVLAPRDPAALTAAVAAVSDPVSPSFRHYLAPGRFAAVYGPAPATVAAVRSWLQGEGLTVGAPVDATVLPAWGPAAQVEAAFSTPVAQVRLPDGTTTYVNGSTPSVPSSLAGAVRTVVGLDGLARPHSELVKGAPLAPAARPGHALTPSTSLPCGAVGQGLGAYSQSQVAGAYGLSPLYAAGRTGAGIRIALYELEGFAQSDVDGFAACYGLTPNVTTTLVDGGPLAGDGPPGTGEAALDIENAMAFAPSAALTVYEGPNNNGTGPLDVYARIAGDDSAQVVSTSWGECEADLTPTGTATAEAQLFQQMAVQGQTVLAAAGDQGSEDCFFTAPTEAAGEVLAVDDPASQPDVTGAGGTSLPTLSPGAPGETVWNNCEGVRVGRCAADDIGGAGGGGISSNWAMPSWQASAGNGTVNSHSSGVPCGAVVGFCREVPDVTGLADPDQGYSVLWSGHWLAAGGTSAVAPLWAALMADVDQGCGATVGLANPALYAAGAVSSDAFFDVTGGDNDYTSTNGGLYGATAGYDLASGWGSPDGVAVAARLQPAGGCPAVTGLSASTAPLNTSTTITVSGASLAGATAVHFGAAGDGTIEARSDGSLTVTTPAVSAPLAVDVTVTTPNGTSAAVPQDRFVMGVVHTGLGYWEVASDGGIFAYGSAGFYGSMGGTHLNRPVVGIAPTLDDRGYWEVASDGGIFAFGDAAFYGSMGGVPLDKPVVGIAPTPDGRGYWEVASDGGVFAFGDAAFYGSMGGIALNRPVVGIAPTWDGRGYWEVASDGGLFAFGDAGFYGSMGGQVLNKPVVAMTSTVDSAGYYEVASDGGLFAFGDAPFDGSAADYPLGSPVVGMASSPTGYWEVGSNGAVYAFGGAQYYGGANTAGLTAPVVGMAAA